MVMPFFAASVSDDIASKLALKREHHKAYISAHEGDFSQEELLPLIGKNMDDFNHILREAARLEEAEPGQDVNKAAGKLMEIIGIHKYADINWVQSTIVQYFEYYRKYHTETFC